MATDCIIYGMLKKILKRQKALEAQVTNFQEAVMAKIDELKQKVVDLQTALDNEQTEIQGAIETLQAQVTALQDQIANGASDAALQEVIDSLSTVISDLEGTIPSAPPTPPILS